MLSEEMLPETDKAWEKKAFLCFNIANDLKQDFDLFFHKTFLHVKTVVETYFQGKAPEFGGCSGSVILR